MSETRWVRFYSEKEQTEPVAEITPARVSVSFYRDCAIVCPDNSPGEKEHDQIQQQESAGKILELMEGGGDVFVGFDALTEKDIDRCAGKFRISGVGGIERLDWDQDRMTRITPSPGADQGCEGEQL